MPSLCSLYSLCSLHSSGYPEQVLAAVASRDLFRASLAASSHRLIGQRQIAPATRFSNGPHPLFIHCIHPLHSSTAFIDYLHRLHSPTAFTDCIHRMSDTESMDRQPEPYLRRATARRQPRPALPMALIRPPCLPCPPERTATAHRTASGHRLVRPVCCNPRRRRGPQVRWQPRRGGRIVCPGTLPAQPVFLRSIKGALRRAKPHPARWQTSKSAQRLMRTLLKP